VNSRLLTGCLALCSLILFLDWAISAPLHLPMPDFQYRYAIPGEMPPFGADDRGRPLFDYVMQGSRVLAVPTVVSGLVVSFLAMLGGLLRCMGSAWVNTIIQAFSEVVGALPRMVVLLVVALILPRDARSLMPLAIAWAILAAPGAMDEAAALAERLGGARFVEALRAHGYGAPRIFLYHLVALNLRPVLVRQGAEVMMQVVFLEISLSYLALQGDQPSFTHSDSMRSWADLLYLGYPSIILDVPTAHALWLGLGLVGLVAVMALSLSHSARAR
jgi:peptide/nickel transport system permease protein